MGPGRKLRPAEAVVCERRAEGDSPTPEADGEPVTWAAAEHERLRGVVGQRGVAAQRIASGHARLVEVDPNRQGTEVEMLRGRDRLGAASSEEPCDERCDEEPR